MRKFAPVLFLLLFGVTGANAAPAPRLPEEWTPESRYPVFDISKVLQLAGLSTAEVYGIGTGACLGVGLFYGAIDTGHRFHRELTNREAWEIIGGCLLPGPGRALLHRLLWNHPEYDFVWPPRDPSEWGGENALSIR